MLSNSILLFWPLFLMFAVAHDCRHKMRAVRNVHTCKMNVFTIFRICELVSLLVGRIVQSSFLVVTLDKDGRQRGARSVRW